eukprot:scaffold13277_cov114-Isochrysis_galbana.AAC.3
MRYEMCDTTAAHSTHMARDNDRPLHTENSNHAHAHMHTEATHMRHGTWHGGMGTCRTGDRRTDGYVRVPSPTQSPQ